MRRAFGVLVFAVFVFAPTLAHATSWTFTKVADTNTAIPGGTGNFTFLSAPSLDGGNVAFNGMGAGQDGIYTYIGGSLGVVADKNTAIPGGTGNFTFLSAPSLDGGNVVFLANGTGQQGVYTYIGGSLSVLADLTTAIPGGTGNFGGLGYPSLDGGNVAFNGWAAGQHGIYTNVGGSLTAVADLTTAIPGGTGDFTYFGYPSLDGGNVAFRGYGYGQDDGSGQEGIYTDVGGSLGVVADLTTAIPGGMGNFTGFYDPSLDGGNVAFTATGTGQEGIYTNVGGSFAVVADLTTAIPGGTGDFTYFGYPSLDGTSVAFNGWAAGQAGIYIWDSLGGLQKVIDLTDTLDGKTISALLLYREGLSGNAIAFRVDFSDGSQGIYIATPEPTTIGILGLGTLGTILLRKRS